MAGEEPALGPTHLSLYELPGVFNFPPGIVEAASGVVDGGADLSLDSLTATPLQFPRIDAPPRTASAQVRAQCAALSDARVSAAAVFERLKAATSRKLELKAAFEAAEAIESGLIKELEGLTAAQVPTGDDPTLWLPDELMLMVFSFAPVRALWDGTLSRVCRRWHTLATSPQAVARLACDKWHLYAEPKYKNPNPVLPRRVTPDPPFEEGIKSLAVAPNGTVYAIDSGGVVRAWRPFNQVTKRMEPIFTAVVLKKGNLAIGSDNVLYVGEGFYSGHVTVVSGETGAVGRTFETPRFQRMAVSPSPDCELILLGRQDGVLRFFRQVADEPDLKPTRTFKLHDPDVDAKHLCYNTALSVNHETGTVVASADMRMVMFQGSPLTATNTITFKDRIPRSIAWANCGTLYAALGRLREKTYGKPGKEDSVGAMFYKKAPGQQGRMFGTKAPVQGLVAAGVDGTAFFCSDRDLQIFLRGSGKPLKFDIYERNGSTKMVAGSDGTVYIVVKDSLFVY